MLMHEHFRSPYHTFVYCRKFVPAAPRRARTSSSVSFAGQLLSEPIQIIGLVGHYPTNSLICRRLILRPELEGGFFHKTSPIGVYPQFPEVIPDLRLDYRRVNAHSASVAR